MNFVYCITEYVVSGCTLIRCVNLIFDEVAANKQTNLNRRLFIFLGLRVNFNVTES